MLVVEPYFILYVGYALCMDKVLFVDIYLYGKSHKNGALKIFILEKEMVFPVV